MKTNNLGLEATRLSRSYPAPFRLHRILFANARVLKIATIFLSFLSFAAVSVHAQAPREAPRPGIAQDFIAWLRHLAPTQRRQSRAVPLPRPRPAELAPKLVEQSRAPAELATGPAKPSEAPAELAPAPEEPKKVTAPVPMNE
jgi:hypothetical protein